MQPPPPSQAGNWTAALHELIAASSSSQEASATKTDSKPASRQSHDVRIEIMATAPRSSQDQATLVPLSASWGQQAAGGCQWGPLHTTSPHSAPLVTAEGHGSGSHSIRLALFKVCDAGAVGCVCMSCACCSRAWSVCCPASAVQVVKLPVTAKSA